MKHLAALIAALCLVSGPIAAGTLESFVDKSMLRITSSSGLPQDCLLAPTITTDVRIQDPQLTRRKPRDTDGLQAGVGILQGLAHMAYGFEIAFQMERIRTDQGICVRVSSMEVRSGQMRPLIWLRPELHEGTCEYEKTVEHEIGHVKNFHDHLRRFEASVQRELPILLRGKSYYRIESMAEAAVAEERLKAEIMGVVGNLHDRSYAIAEARDRSMDSPAEYHRLSNLCR